MYVPAKLCMTVPCGEALRDCKVVQRRGRWWILLQLRMDAGLGAQGRGVDCGISSPILDSVLDDKYASGRVTNGLPPAM